MYFNSCSHNYSNYLKFKIEILLHHPFSDVLQNAQPEVECILDNCLFFK